MEVRYLENCEKNRIRELYEKVFEDSVEFTDYYFENICNNDILVLEENENILSMLQLVKKKVVYNNELVDVHYIYGVATDEAHRGRGYMDKLMIRALEDVKALGEPFVYLVPKNPNIYLKYGFETVYEKQIYEIRRINEDDKIYNPSEWDIKIMKNLADNILPMKYKLFVEHSEEYIRDVVAQLKIDKGYLVYQMENDEIIGYSIVGHDNFVWESVYDTKSANLYHIKTVPWIMIKKFDDDLDIRKVYINDET